jgi:hypothetical protein
MPYKISRSERQVQEEMSKQCPLSEFEEKILDLRALILQMLIAP